MERLVIFIIALALTGCGPDDHEDGAGPTVGAPIDAPAEEWTWVDVPDAVCGNGEPTGIGVNLTDRSNDVFVYFMGGGACWDAESCLALRTAVNVQSGYDAAMFEKELKLNAFSFDRDDADNPFREMNFVYVPYCTGDVHAGDNVATYSRAGESEDVHHHGAANVQAFLRRLAPTFADPDHVFVAGSSAGGFGAQLNFHRFAATFGDAEVHALSDSAPLVQPSGTLFDEWKAAWNVQTPPSCARCTDGFPQWFDHLTSMYPASRFGLLSYANDQIIRLFFGYPLGGRFRATLASFVDEHVAPAQTAEAYIVEGGQHVLMINGLGMGGSDEEALADWLRDWVEGDAAWTSTRLP